MTETRAPVKERAGTKLDWRFCRTVVVDGKNAGTLDLKQGVYQHGGQRGNFVLHTMNAVTFPYSVWLAIRDAGIATIEMIDHRLNECYRCSVNLAREHGCAYTASIGERFAIPLVCFDRIDSHGELVA